MMVLLIYPNYGKLACSISQLFFGETLQRSKLEVNLKYIGTYVMASVIIFIWKGIFFKFKRAQKHRTKKGLENIYQVFDVVILADYTFLSILL